MCWCSSLGQRLICHLGVLLWNCWLTSECIPLHILSTRIHVLTKVEYVFVADSRDLLYLLIVEMNFFSSIVVLSFKLIKTCVSLSMLIFYRISSSRCVHWKFGIYLTCMHAQWIKDSSCWLWFRRISEVFYCSYLLQSGFVCPSTYYPCYNILNSNNFSEVVMYWISFLYSLQLIQILMDAAWAIFLYSWK